jgi:murein DD-endopeptidase MepM/ murein hydrolase activator NlpD
MSHARAALCCAVAAVSLAVGAPAAHADENPGGAAAPATPSSLAAGVAVSPARTGGSAYGAVSARPTVGWLHVPASASEGVPPPVTFEVDEPGVASLAVRVTVNDLSTRQAVIVASQGWVAAGRVLAVRWPAGARLRAGSYHVSIAAHDRHHGNLVRRARSSGVARLEVLAPSVAAPPAGVIPAEGPGPAETAAAGAVFPVAGPHSLGGPENRFGAPRVGHIHQGQDILAAEGTPIVAPLAGTIITAAYQAGRAGYYVAEHTVLGLDFMFAHCRSGSVAVLAGQAVGAGQTLCQAGQTGDATAPHLHFEIWLGGWQAQGGHPVDPLPYLLAWDHSAG